MWSMIFYGNLEVCASEKFEKLGVNLYSVSTYDATAHLIIQYIFGIN